MSVIAHQTEKECISANEKSRQIMSQTQAEDAAEQHAARPEDAHLSATLVFDYHSDMTKKRILTKDKIDRYVNNLDELSEDGLEYSDVDFYLIMSHLMMIRIATVKIVLVHKIQFRI
ncbi:hypothetical protein TNCV_5131051 [Trichonephila clavipes]|nr:hypothetical protein TNCV_5131051 [Trichonephila clavipes]